MPKVPHVIEVISGYGVESPLGGIERFVLELCQQIDPKQVRVSVYGLWRYNTPYEQEWINRLSAAHIDTFIGPDWDVHHPYRSFLRAYSVMKRALRKTDVTIIHSHGQFCDLAALLYSWQAPKIQTYRTVHHEFEWKKRPVRRILLTNLLFPIFFDDEVGVSQAVQKELDQRLISQVLHRRAKWIPNAVNLDRFKCSTSMGENLRKELNIPPEAFVVGSVGRMVKEKGFEDLITAISKTIPGVPSVYLILIGGGDELEPLKTVANELSINNRVRFTGPRNHVEELLGSMDLFVSSSHVEAMPTVLLESMAAGVPIVATETTGATALITPEVNGWLTPVRDSTSMAAKILEAYSRPDKRAEFSTKAKEVVTQYSIQSIARVYEDFYIQKTYAQSS